LWIMWDMKTVAIIPARGNSKGIQKKNVANLAGKPLLVYSIEQALQSSFIDKVVVSSDDDAILNVAKKFAVETIRRPPEFSHDTAPMDGVIKHALDILIKQNYEADLVVLLQPTSPLRRLNTVNSAISAFIKNRNKFDSLMPLSETSSKVGTLENKRFVPSYFPGAQRQELEKTYFDCGTIHIFKPEIIRAGKFFGERIYGFFIDWPESLDIDETDDMKLAEYFLMNLKQ